MHPLSERDRSVAVAEIVEPRRRRKAGARKQRPKPRAQELPTVERPADLIAEQQAAILPGRARREPLLELRGAMLPERHDDAGLDLNPPPAVRRLGLEELQAARGRLERHPDGDRAGIEVRYRPSLRPPPLRHQTLGALLRMSARGSHRGGP